MKTVPNRPATLLSTMLASTAAVSLLGVLLSVAVSYRVRGEHRQPSAPRPRAAHIATYALA